MLVVATIASANAQAERRPYDNRTYGDDSYGNQSYGNNNYNDDRYYYDDEFDWHWDVRVRISNGIQAGQITQNESRRLYNQLENLERKEYAYQSDGIYTNWEQQEVWDDIAYLNRRLGIELYDFDRTFYGFNNWGRDYRGYNRWFYQGGYDFYRFDRRGFGNVRIGYVCRPDYVGWYRNNNNHVARNYYTERSRSYGNRNNDSRGNDRDSRGNDRRSYNDNNRNSQRNNNEKQSRGEYENSRNSKTPANDYGRNLQEKNNNETRANRPNSSVELRSDNYGKGSGVDNSRSERNVPSQSTQESSGRTSRGDRSPNVERPNRSVESAPSQPSSGGQSRGGRSENTSSDSPKSSNEGRSESRGRRN